MSSRWPLLVALHTSVLLAACAEEAPPSAPPPASNASPVTLEGGLVIQDRSVGDGPQAAPDDHVEVEFVARLASGEVWDSTEKRNRTLTLDLANPALIEGLRRGIPGMRPGGSRTIEIPWALAYGTAGRDPVPPRTDLIYDITLVAIHEPPASDEPDAPSRSEGQ